MPLYSLTPPNKTMSEEFMRKAVEGHPNLIPFGGHTGTGVYVGSGDHISVLCVKAAPEDIESFCQETQWEAKEWPGVVPEKTVQAMIMRYKNKPLSEELNKASESSPADQSIRVARRAILTLPRSVLKPH